MKGAGGLAAALVPVLGQGNRGRDRPASLASLGSYGTAPSTGTGTSTSDGTPEQVHLTWGDSDQSIDWVAVQMHQDALTSSITGNGSDLGIRQAWLPLFDQYEVDLVVCGHDHDYERSFPVRGYDSNVGVEAATGQTVGTRRPRPVTTSGHRTFDTSQVTVFPVLGGGGTNANLDDYGLDTADGLPRAKVFTQPNRPFETSDDDGLRSAAAEPGRRSAATRQLVALGGVAGRPLPNPGHPQRVVQRGRRRQ